MKVVHNSGWEVLSVSSDVDYIAKNLHNHYSTSSYKIMGTILGDRMIKCGIQCVSVQVFEPKDLKKPKMASLLAALESQGVRIGEPEPLHYNQLPVPLNLKPMVFARQPNNQYEMLGSKFEHHHFKRMKMREELKARNEKYFSETDDANLYR